MIPFTSPEIQYELIREHNDALVREAADHRRARQAAERTESRIGRWPRVRRKGRPARQLPV